MASRSQLADLLRRVYLAQLAIALLWLWWRWPEAPGQALAGALVVLLFTPIILGLEFLILARVARTDTVPVPSAGMLLLAWLGEIRELVRVFYWRQPWRWQAEPDQLQSAASGAQGVVFIHGFVCNRGLWAPWMRRLRAQGDCFVAVNLEPVFTSIDNYVPLVDAAVRRVTEATGAPPVLVCHSMGGLVARAWLRSGDHASRVKRVVTIGTPHHGTWLARWSHVPNGRQMRLHGPWVQQLQQDEARAVRPPFTCWYSNCDNIVFPTSTAMLPGADNRLVPGPAHVDLAFHPEVMEATLAMVAAP